MKVTDLRNAFEAGRPLVEQWLDLSEQFAALRDLCREREIDWQQVKTLLKATMQDSRDGSDKRVKALLAKADTATAYAEELGLGASPEKKNNFSRETVSIAAGTPEPAQPQSKTRESLQASVALTRAGADPFDMPDIPAVLRRAAQ